MSLFSEFKLDYQEYEDILTEIRSINEIVEVPVGSYEVKITNVKCGLNKNNIPKISIYFKILNGEYENQMLFYNQNLDPTNTAIFNFQLRLLCKMLISLESDVEISMERLINGTEELLKEIFEAVKLTKEYVLESKVNEKGYKELKVSSAFNSDIF